MFSAFVTTTTLTLNDYDSFLSHDPRKRFARSSGPGTLIGNGVCGICAVVHDCSVATNAATLTVRYLHSRSRRGKDVTDSKSSMTRVCSSFGCATSGNLLNTC